MQVARKEVFSKRAMRLLRQTTLCACSLLLFIMFLKSLIHFSLFFFVSFETMLFYRYNNTCKSSLLLLSAENMSVFITLTLFPPSSSKDPFIWGHSDHSLDEGGATTM